MLYIRLLIANRNNTLEPLIRSTTYIVLHGPIAEMTAITR